MLSLIFSLLNKTEYLFDSQFCNFATLHETEYSLIELRIGQKHGNANSSLPESPFKQGNSLASQARQITV